MQDADLVVVEFTFNEAPSAPYTAPARRGIEALLRALLRLPKGPAVLVLHHYAWWHAHGDGADGGLFYRQAEEQLGTLAQVGGYIGHLGQLGQGRRFPRRVSLPQAPAALPGPHCVTLRPHAS